MNILSMKEVREKVKLSSTTIWRKESCGEFPKRINLSGPRVGWSESEIDEWLENLPRGIITKNIRGKE